MNRSFCMHLDGGRGWGVFPGKGKAGMERALEAGDSKAHLKKRQKRVSEMLRVGAECIVN